MPEPTNDVTLATAAPDVAVDAEPVTTEPTAAEPDERDGTSDEPSKPERLGPNNRAYTGLHVVEEFEGPTRWLSNFDMTHPFTFDGQTFPSGEHAFHVRKNDDPEYLTKMLAAKTPGAAKGLGRKVALRSDWEAVKRSVMAEVVAARCTNDDFRARLLGTDKALLIEGNHHHDREWGDCLCDEHFSWPGKNWLGKALMEQRRLLRLADGLDPEGVDLYHRVAVTGHRPSAMTPQQDLWATAQLQRLADKLVANHGMTTAIGGMALGADQRWAAAGIGAGANLWAYIPFKKQHKKWRENDVAYWKQLRKVAQREVVLSKKYDVRLLHARNDYMIRDADLMICVYDPEKTTGGTASAVKKIRRSGMAHVIVDIRNETVKMVKATVPDGS